MSDRTERRPAWPAGSLAGEVQPGLPKEGAA
jgi:hypothetical protein